MSLEPRLLFITHDLSKFFIMAALEDSVFPNKAFSLTSTISSTTCLSVATTKTTSVSDHVSVLVAINRSRIVVV
jgi:hypothetical protein